jgi:hypothetical protein
MVIGGRTTQWNLSVTPAEANGNLYIPRLDKWGAPFLIKIIKPDLLIYKNFTIDILKKRVLHQENIAFTPQTVPDTYSIFIEEVPYPGDRTITYTIVVKFRDRTLSKDVRINYSRVP